MDSSAELQPRRRRRKSEDRSVEGARRRRGVPLQSRRCDVSEARALRVLVDRSGPLLVSSGHAT